MNHGLNTIPYHRCLIDAKITKDKKGVAISLYNEYISSFEELYQRDDSKSGHHRNIQSLWTELYYVKSNISNQIMSEIFIIRNVNHNFSNTDRFCNYPCKYIIVWLKSSPFFLLTKPGKWYLIKENTQVLTNWDLK